jgi:hypothetical protein
VYEVKCNKENQETIFKKFKNTQINNDWGLVSLNQVDQDGFLVIWLFLGLFI